MSQFYEYKKHHFSCEKCKWIGVGEQTDGGDIINWESIEILCPKCYNLLAMIMLPTFEETMKYGTDREKADVQKRQNFVKRLHSSYLANCDQLPDIDADKIIIALCEEEPISKNIDGHIILCYGGKEIWREVRSFEYYPRYLKLGELLKEKYGERLVDFEVEYTVHLGGDFLNAFDKVDEFRKSLKKSNT